MKVIIVGAGEVGYHIASCLAAESKNVVVIDKDVDAIRRVSENIDVQTIRASGSSPAVLEEAGIKSAEILLAVTNSDESNLVSCLVANMISPATKKLARIRSADYDDYHQMFSVAAPHIDTVINPEIEVVNTILRIMRVPCAVDMGELAGGKVIFVGLVLDKNSPMVNLRLADFGSLFGQSRPLIAAIVRNEKLIVPRGEHTLKYRDVVYFICEKGRLEETLELFGEELKPVKRVIVVGGGRIGHRLAKTLEAESIQTKIIESNLQRCQFLSERMDKTVILHGDGSDQKLLIEEGVQDADVVVTLTHNEETNILISLLAKSLGGASTITKVSNFSYFPLMSAIGLKKVVSPRLSAISSILHNVRKGKILSVISLLQEDAEIIEAMALETSAIVDKPLKKISFPKGAILILIIRDDFIMIPTGDSVVNHGDKIIIFATKQAIPKVEKMLTVKLSFF
ncbi:MAG: Trk system potassium transporter TrkA [Desulfamplus sp.]|nr:Trk system potassium transporter TrkA [Desulfamplus sp.]